MSILHSYFQRAFAIQHGQRAEGAGFVDVGAVTVVGAFGDQAFALPEKFGGVAIDGLLDAAAKGVVLVGQGAAAWQALAVLAVFETSSGRCHGVNGSGCRFRRKLRGGGTRTGPADLRFEPANEFL